jgi:hypothetical protein
MAAVRTKWLPFKINTAAVSERIQNQQRMNPALLLFLLFLISSVSANSEARSEAHVQELQRQLTAYQDAAAI